MSLWIAILFMPQYITPSYFGPKSLFSKRVRMVTLPADMARSLHENVQSSMECAMSGRAPPLWKRSASWQRASPHNISDRYLNYLPSQNSNIVDAPVGVGDHYVDFFHYFVIFSELSHTCYLLNIMFISDRHCSRSAAVVTIKDASYSTT